MKITRTTATDYAVITPTILATGGFLSDDCMRLDGNTLRSHEQAGHIRVGGLLNIHLGPIALAKVQALAIGETADFSEDQPS